MKKNIKNTKKEKPPLTQKKYQDDSSRELKVFIEHFDHKFDLVLDMKDFLVKRMDDFEENVNKKFEAVDYKFEVAFEKIGDVEKRLGGVEGRLGGVEGRLGGVEGRLDGVEGRLGSVETELKAVRHDLKNKGDQDEILALEKRVVRLERNYLEKSGCKK